MATKVALPAVAEGVACVIDLVDGREGDDDRDDDSRDSRGGGSVFECDSGSSEIGIRGAGGGGEKKARVCLTIPYQLQLAAQLSCLFARR